jgi:hypothetical protein
MQRRDLLKLSPLALAGSVGHISLAEAQAEAHTGDATYNVRNFGEAGDGKTVDTPAINKAIDAVAAAGGVHRADFFAISAPRQQNFSLHNVSDFRLGWSRAANDTNIAQTASQVI